MKKKALSVVYVLLCLILCVSPFAGMLFAPTNETIGNERPTEFPSLKNEDESINKDFVKQLSDYFGTHFAFRPNLVNLDADIQSKVFASSNLPSVVVGKNGNLFYSSTLDNFSGRNIMSEREIFNIVNNLEITQKYLSKNGIEFLFTVAPNKNTLYSENMPYYYSKKESEERNLTLLNNALKSSKVSYCDLEDLFKNQSEVLYLKRDSHWNDKGALLAYDKILTSINKPHENYANAKVKRAKTFQGDLGKMLYPLNAEPEFNYQYDINQTYSYITPTKSVEEAIISTQNKKANGSLYMYRDSFGNALLPFFANAYGRAYFTKTFPVNLALDTATQKSETVIFEIVERNLSWLCENPPVLPAPEHSKPKLQKGEIKQSNLKAQISNVNMQYVCLSGELYRESIANESKIFLLVKDSDGIYRMFEAFTTSDEKSDCGFKAYIPASFFENEKATVCIAVKKDGKYFHSKATSLDIAQAEF